MADLYGAAVVVLAAGDGVGRAAALAAGRHGARVVVNDADRDAASEVAAEICAVGSVAFAHHSEVTDGLAISALFDACHEQFGRVDGLVNAGSAAIAPGLIPRAWLGRDADGPVADGTELVPADVGGRILCGAEAFRHMRRRRRGMILNLIPEVEQDPAAVAPIASLTRDWARLARRLGVRVNAIAPRRGDDGDRPSTADLAALIVCLLGAGGRDVNGCLLDFDGRRLRLAVEPAAAADVGLAPAPADFARALDVLAADARRRPSRRDTTGSG